MLMQQIIHVVGLMNMGGTETMLMNLYREIDRTRYQFIFVTFSSEKGIYDDEIIRLGGSIWHVGSPYSFLGFLKLKKQFPNVSIAHMHTYFNCGINALWFRLLGFDKIISHSHTAFPKSNKKLKLCYEKISQWLINNLSTKRLACSQDAAFSLFGYNENYTFLPNFVDPLPFIQAKKINIKGVVQVGHVGRFSSEKNHEFIIELARFSKLNKSPVCFNLVGAGPLLQTIQDQIEKENLQDYVKLKGISNQIPQIMNEFDCFILPSTVEGFGLVLLEAQASGLPCFVSHAIQPEAILDLNLVKSLDYNVKEWIENILQVKQYSFESSQILSSFKRANLDYLSIIKKIENIYEE
jgi:glycosyltransferase EpsF